ncbi:MAG: GAF domain-containing protein [Candidatus Dadabacteria bacterium]|nr:GAF domain-containing protein [Candidatus Dadabacteria bacterium]NIS08436.1 GAF domain-containing protein [Candidatus Dadabacteria bacterium]NIV42001.1 GAF domain-containing protein [Candidatus Dadabacteria bacterium]NIY21924.1 GAF domain-containing protein [Candidatus Dadabacteria bacterium]
MSTKSSKKTKKQLIEELEQMQNRVAELEAAQLDQNKASHDKLGTGKTYEDLEILNTITQAIHQSLDLENLYRIAINKIAELQSVDIPLIYMVEEVGDEKVAVLHAHRNLPEDYIARAGKIPYPKGLTLKVINSGQILNIENLQKNKDIGPAGRDLGHHSALGIPIISETQTIGVLWIASYKEQMFDEKDIKLLTYIGNQISAAIAKSRLYEQLSRKNHYGEIIRTVAHSVHQSLDLQDVFENAVEVMNENIDVASNVSIFMAEGKDAVLKASRGFPDSFVEKIKTIPYPKGFTWKTIIEEKVIYCPDVDRDKVIGAAGRKLGTKSYVAIPIRDEEMTVGCLNVHCYEKNGFGEEEIELLQTISEQIGVAINNARKASAINESKARLSGILEISEDAIISVNEM